jgi:hypothetical protein
MSDFVENKDYELIPADNDFWQVRFLTGDFVETVIQYGSIRLDGKNVEKEDDVKITFSFDIVSTPDDTLTTDDIDLQIHCGNVLSEILKNAFDKKEEMLMREVE